LEDGEDFLGKGGKVIFITFIGYNTVLKLCFSCEEPKRKVCTAAFLALDNEAISE